MDTSFLKKKVALAALSHIEPDCILGIGSGSTVNALIEAMARENIAIKAAVASSLASEQLLRQHGFNVISLEETNGIDLYLDGADAVDPCRRLLKGGGGALTREKIVASAASKFICIVDASKRVDQLGQFPLAIEIIPMARMVISRQLTALGGRPQLRHNFITDNGLQILDVWDMDFSSPEQLESELNQIPGIVCHGLFARRPADLVMVAHSDGLTHW